MWCIRYSSITQVKKVSIPDWRKFVSEQQNCAMYIKAFTLHVTYGVCILCLYAYICYIFILISLYCKFDFNNSQAILRSFKVPRPQGKHKFFCKLKTKLNSKIKIKTKIPKLINHIWAKAFSTFSMQNVPGQWLQSYRKSIKIQTNSTCSKYCAPLSYLSSIQPNPIFLKQFWSKQSYPIWIGINLMELSTSLF